MSTPSRMLDRNRAHYKPSEAVRPRLFTWRRKAATVVAGGLAVVMGYGVIFGHNGLTAFRQKREEEQRLQHQMQQLQQENSRLREHVERLQNDPGAIEHEAREELHYTRPGEVIYTLSAEESAATARHPGTPLER